MREKFIINERWVSDDRRTDIQVTNAIITRPKELYVEVPDAWGKLDEKEYQQIKMIMNYYLQEEYNKLYSLYIKKGQKNTYTLPTDALIKVKTALAENSIAEVYSDLLLKIKNADEQWNKANPIILDEQYPKEFFHHTEYKLR